MVASSMELRRLGLARKPAHVVPNHMLEQYTAEFVRLYPFASVLMGTVCLGLTIRVYEWGKDRFLTGHKPAELPGFLKKLVHER